jgi:16S rRNA (uracil1498-N3)-methyltransferase
MRHRIHVPEISPTVTVTGDEFHHAVRVARVRQGEEVELFDDAGRAARAKVRSIERDEAVVDLVAELPSRESPLDIHLAVAVIQLEKFELVLQKATELGVRAITPLVTDHVEIRKERYAGKSDRWKKIIFEAVKQSGRSRIPTLHEPAAFADLIAGEGIKVLFDADAEPGALAKPEALTLLIGPEGGWSDEELASARAAGCVFQRLGPRRLRAETAAIVAVTAVLSRFGDL